MITELQKNEFYRCKALLNEHGQLEVKAVVAGVNPGRIFVDQIDSPQSALIWLGNNDGFLFIGNEDNEQFNNQINDFIDQVIVPEAKKVGLYYIEGIGNHQKWNKTIEKIFKHRGLGSWKQRVHKLHKENYKANNEPDIKEGYTVLKMDNALFEDNTIKNPAFLHSKILSFWASIECFLNTGIGYCIVYDRYIVSLCFSGFVVENTHCIDIETLEAHRGNKLAQKLAHYFVKDCLTQSSVPYWDCMDSNKPSIAVAENIGFSNVFNYVGYEFSFN
ncbi:GNAT family N-acetyltransferase [Lysinibacillus sp. KCTC 33748]|uniref:GNAT family N-acetyltransferase n=1 Tax=unclassified Lysinibacillus TaxID=2636778 RepID=UPI0009A58F48|nr:MULTISPECIES: GNAT family N-acetyltransferase [unclassified Lysinibacillus]OXS74096.1 GNAT family N-acetyltransferase [Lysinibacillus sp. KCTC 33748]SKB70798.1 GNAT acetyltransferase [Lysinibacillus sp. AC-3]